MLHKIHKKERGVVLMIVMTTIAFLVVIVQQMGFDSHVELKNGVSQYHSFKAYTSAKSGLKLAVFRILIYKKIQESLKKNPNNLPAGLIDQIQPRLNQLWKEPLIWPLVVEEDANVFQKEDIEKQIESSFFGKEAAYQTVVESEGAKLDLNDLSSPDFYVREWAKKTLFNLLIQLRSRHPWIEKTYSENQIQSTVDSIALLFDPSSLFSASYYPPKTTLMNIRDLIFADGVREELIEFLKPYVTLFGEEGLQLRFADPLLLQSLHKDINHDWEETFENNPQELLFANAKTTKDFFQNFTLIVDDYFTNTPPLSQLIFNFDAPQNFKITSYGKSGSQSRGLSAVLYDPLVIHRSFHLFELRKKQKYKADTSIFTKQELEDIKKYSEKHEISPFIIHWNNIN